MYYFVNVSFANIYRKPTFHSEVDTQVVLWEKLEVMEKIDAFLRVQTEDHYEGWLNEHQIAVCRQPQAELRLVTQTIVDVFGEPNTQADLLRRIGAGAYLPVLEEKEGWCKVLLPDEQTGYITSAAFAPVADFKRQEALRMAQQFLGVTYIWGGKTPFGLDCSGLVQLTFKLLGQAVRRDAWMQFEDARPVSTNPAEARVGDLYFFAENGDKITHVALALGNKKFIHARGMVRINSLDEDHPDFSPDLLHDFVEVRTFF